ncbi:MAG: hypothetical protein EXS49_00060 [Candidatus Pacebacteria bacterium]|nr:hypothetical protein [Candidatus Paceibacterota bacterium]
MKALMLVLAVLLVGASAGAVSSATSAEPTTLKMVDPFVSATVTVNGVVVEVEFVDLSTGLTLTTTNPALVAMASDYVSDPDTSSARFTKDVSDGNGGKKKVEMTITVTKRSEESGKEFLRRFEKRCEDAISSGWEPVVTPTSNVYDSNRPVLDVVHLYDRDDPPSDIGNAV